jgi:hypothetical protein
MNCLSGLTSQREQGQIYVEAKADHDPAGKLKKKMGFSLGWPAQHFLPRSASERKYIIF